MHSQMKLFFNAVTLKSQVHYLITLRQQSLFVVAELIVIRRWQACPSAARVSVSEGLHFEAFMRNLMLFSALGIALFKINIIFFVFGGLESLPFCQSEPGLKTQPMVSCRVVKDLRLPMSTVVIRRRIYEGT